MTSPPQRLPFVDGLRRHGERPALLSATEVVSYAALADRVAAVAERLGPQRRLVLVGGAHRIDVVVGYLAALAGGHAVLLVTGDDAEHVEGWVRHYDPDVVLLPAPDGVLVDERRAGSANVLHPDLALLLSTSGSTGSPKLVRLPYDAVQANAASIATSLGITPDDRAVTSLPMAYCYGLSVLHSHLLVGAGVVLTELSVSEPCFWELVRAREVSSLAGVPHTFSLLDRVGFAGMDLPALRTLTQAGGAMPPEAVRRYAAHRRLFVMYGQTEATARMACLPPERVACSPGSIGVAVPGGRLLVRPPDSATAELPDGVEGELVYQGPNVMMGYASGPRDLRFGRTVHELRTGDRGRRRPDGTFEVTGRPGRTVKLFGLRIDLDHVQRELDRAGCRAWCLAEPERVVVLVEPGEPDVGTRVRRATGLPAHAVVVQRVEQLPRTTSGKLDAERAKLLAQPPAPPAPTTVAALYAQVLGVRVRGQDSFVALGGDSLSYVEVVLRLEDLLGQVPADWPSRTVAELQDGMPAAGAGPARAGTDVTVLLRAAGILLVVASHVHLSPVLGGAHSLLAVAGYNFARLRLTGVDQPRRTAGYRAAVRALALSSVVIITLAALVTPGVGPVQVLQLNALLGPDALGNEWRYWFVEALLWILVGVTLLLAVPGVDRFERRRPLLLPLALLAVGLLPRLGLVPLGGEPDRTQSAAALLWLFALGWCLARASTTAQRLGLTALAGVLLVGFFPNPWQGLVVLVAIAALAWCPRVPLRLGAPGRRLLGVLASSSLYIYLVHWQVLDLAAGLPPLLVAALCLTAGVLAWQVSLWAQRAVHADRLAGSAVAGVRRRLPVRRPGRAGVEPRTVDVDAAQRVP